MNTLVKPTSDLANAIDDGLTAHPNSDATVTDGTGKSTSPRPAEGSEMNSGNETNTIPESPARRAIRLYFDQAMESNAGISALRWRQANLEITGTISARSWLFGVLREYDRKGETGGWDMQLSTSPHPEFNGNMLIKDITIGKAGTMTNNEGL